MASAAKCLLRGSLAIMRIGMNTCPVLHWAKIVRSILHLFWGRLLLWATLAVSDRTCRSLYLPVTKLNPLSPRSWPRRHPGLWIPLLPSRGSVMSMADNGWYFPAGYLLPGQTRSPGDIWIWCSTAPLLLFPKWHQNLLWYFLPRTLSHQPDFGQLWKVSRTSLLAIS